MPESPDWKQELGPLVRVGQIVVGALIFGCLTFGVIAIVMSGQVADQVGPIPGLITYIAIGFAVIAVAARAVVGVTITANGRRQIAEGTWKPTVPANPQNAELFAKLGDAGKLFGLYQTRLIVTAALLEGPAFFLLIAHMLEGTTESLIVAGAMVAGLVLQFPTHGRVVTWIEHQLQIIEQQRAFDGR